MPVEPEQTALTGETSDIEAIITALTEEDFSDQRSDQAEKLLRYALETRDTRTALIVTRLMDSDPVLDERLNEVFYEVMETQPDAVYFVIRTRLAQDISPRWLPRLQVAAMQSLRIALNDSDTATLSSWLKLIVREPVAYDLGEVLEQGIMAAQERTHEEGTFGFQLLLIAAKRTPALLDKLLADEALVAALPEEVEQAVHQYEPEALKGLLAQGRGLYLATLDRAAQECCDDNEAAAQIFTPETIQQVWEFYQDEQPYPLPERFQPAHLIQMLVREGSAWLSDAALTRLVTLMLAHPGDTHFADAMPNMMRQVFERNPKILLNALEAGSLNLDTTLNLIGGAVSSGTLTPQQSTNLYLQMLQTKNWHRSAVPAAEQIARTLQQQQGLTLPPETLWKLMSFAAETRTELITRVLTRRLIADLEKADGDRQFVDQFMKLTELTYWNQSTRHALFAWWRDYSRHQPLPRLQQFEKMLEPKKALDEPRTILNTAIALRRIFGKRSLEDFASAVGTAYTILQALSDAFDPEPRHSAQVDQITLRAELEAHADELPEDEQRILAKNLKELGNLIADMAEHRSRATLIRREEEVERQLMTGEQQPQSAIDMMKWLSGYLEGVQDEDFDEP